MDHPSQIRVLLIEDDPIDRVLYQLCLRQFGTDCQFEFAEAASALAGIEMTFDWKPDCILLDYNLPDLDGIAVLSRLTGEGRHPCAVVMLTSYGGEALAVRAMKAGAMDYLVKGKVAGDNLARTVLHAIERFQMQQQIAKQQADLERSRQNYQDLLEAIPQMVWTAGPDGRMAYANRRWFEYTGLDLEVAGCMGWERLLHPDDFDRTRIAWEEAAEAASVFEIEHRLRRSCDGSYRWHLVRAVPIRKESGGIANWFGTSTEIEDQKRAEAAAREQQKREVVTALATGIAHDFNNLLVGVLGGASCAMECLPPYHPAQKMLEGVTSAAERAAELTRKMLSCAGKGSFPEELTNFGQLVCNTCDSIRPAIPHNIRMECRPGRAIPPVVMDSGQLREVVVDLVMNAVESIPEGIMGTISVHTAAVEIDGAQSSANQFRPEAIPPGQYIALEVRDTGCGMDEETRSKIFEPFFSTKFLGRGLGLASVYGFVLSHSGGVQVESAPGKGTTFRLLLPAAVKEPVSAAMTT